MAHFRKKLKWWLRDLRSFVTGKSGAAEPKTIWVLRCRGCNGHHQMKITQIALQGMEFPPVEEMFSNQPIKCPTTGAQFYSAQDDWVHLTEREFDLHFRRK